MADGTEKPVRSCCGCGQRETRDQLVRMAVVEGSLVADFSGRRGGRGAYLHRDPECWMLFVRGTSYVRSLRRRVARAEREVLTGTLRAALDREVRAPGHVG